MKVNSLFCLLSLYVLTFSSIEHAAASPTFDVIFSFPDAPGEYIGYTTSISAIDGKLFGVTRNNINSSGRNLIYSINPDGTDYQVLHSFDSDSDQIVGKPIAVGSRIYGTTSVTSPLSPAPLSSIFSMNADGSDFQTIYTPEGTAEIITRAGLTLEGARLYGATSLWETTSSSGTNVGSTVFSIALDGSDFQTIYEFERLTMDPHSLMSQLTITNGRIYGASLSGGTNGVGTIYSMNLDGTDFSVLHNFSGSDGRSPNSQLLQIGDKLYGTTRNGGHQDSGTIFSIGLDGSDYQLLHSLEGFDANEGDGAHPVGDLLVIDGRLYGATLGHEGLGSNPSRPIALGGSVFTMYPDGSNFEVIQRFGSFLTGDGIATAGLTSIHNTLYGYNTALLGNEFAWGPPAIFSITVPEWNGGALTGLGIGLLAILRFRRGRVAAAK